MRRGWLFTIIVVAIVVASLFAGYTYIPQAIHVTTQCGNIILDDVSIDGDAVVAVIDKYAKYLQHPELISGDLASRILRDAFMYSRVKCHFPIYIKVEANSILTSILPNPRIQIWICDSNGEVVATYRGRLTRSELSDQVTFYLTDSIKRDVLNTNVTTRFNGRYTIDYGCNIKVEGQLEVFLTLPEKKRILTEATQKFMDKLSELSVNSLSYLRIDGYWINSEGSKILYAYDGETVKYRLDLKAEASLVACIKVEIYEVSYTGYKRLIGNYTFITALVTGESKSYETPGFTATYKFLLRGYEAETYIVTKSGKHLMLETLLKIKT